MTWVGIDVSKAKLDIAMMSREGEINKRTVSNDSASIQGLISELRLIPDVMVGVEATGSYHIPLARAVDGAGIALCVLNPRSVHHFANSLQRRNKTDAADAVVIAMFIRERQPRVRGVSGSLRSSLAREIAALEEDLVRLKNRLEAQQRGWAHPRVIESITRSIDALKEHKEALERELARETMQHEARALELLQSIPGLALKSSCLLLAELGDVTRFSSARALVAFVGLSPRVFVSGSSVNKRTGITRWGSHRVRKLLYLPALTGIRWNPLLKETFERLTSRGKPKMVALVACMAKLLRIIYGVLTRGRPFDPKLVGA